MNTKYQRKEMKKENKNHVNIARYARKKTQLKKNKYWASKVTKEDEHWQFDVIGPIATSEDGYRYILSQIDLFSRYVHLVPLKSKSQQEVRKAVEKILNESYTKPKKITSDIGLKFKIQK